MVTFGAHLNATGVKEDHKSARGAFSWKQDEMTNDSF